MYKVYEKFAWYIMLHDFIIFEISSKVLFSKFISNTFWNQYNQIFKIYCGIKVYCFIMKLSECILKNQKEQRTAWENALMECQSSSTKSYVSSNKNTVQCDKISKLLFTKSELFYIIAYRNFFLSFNFREIIEVLKYLRQNLNYIINWSSYINQSTLT